MGWALTYLAVATRARRSEFPKLLVYVPLVAGVVQALATITSTLATNLAISDFLAGSRTVDAAADVTGSGLGVFASLLGLPGALGHRARAGPDQPERDARGPADALHGGAWDDHRRAAGASRSAARCRSCRPSGC